MFKQKKSFVQLISVLLLLLLGVSTFVILNNWGVNFIDLFKNDKLQKMKKLSEENIVIIKFVNNSGDYNLYVRNHLNNDLEIINISVNGVNCVFLGGNVLISNKESLINLSCTSVSILNDIVIYSNDGIVESVRMLK